MADKMVFWDDLDVKSPIRNLLINRACVDLIGKGEYDLIARTYFHDKGVILGRGESIEDIYEDVCEKDGYEVVSRPSGGSAILVGPDSTLCYSIFFNSARFGGRFNIHEVYKSIVLPLARNLGDEFSVVGNYYLRYNLDEESIPIAGHAIKSYGEVTQFDGIVNLKRFDMAALEKVLRLRELWEFNGKKYLKVNGRFYDLDGGEVNLDENSPQFLRSEKQELEKIIGLEEIGISTTKFKQNLRKSLEEVFGEVHRIKGLSFKDVELDRYAEYLNLGNNYKGRRFLGHCFVDLVEEEQEIVCVEEEKP